MWVDRRLQTGNAWYCKEELSYGPKKVHLVSVPRLLRGKPTESISDFTLFCLLRTRRLKTAFIVNEERPNLLPSPSSVLIIVLIG